MSDPAVAQDQPKSVTRKPRGGPIKPGQYLLHKAQVLELCGDPSYSTLWLWMTKGDFPHPLVLGPTEGRTSRVAWRAEEVYAWLDARPRRPLGRLKERRAAQDQQAAAKRAPAQPEKPVTRDLTAAALAAYPSSKSKSKPQPALESPEVVVRRLVGVRKRPGQRTTR